MPTAYRGAAWSSPLASQQTASGRYRGAREGLGDMGHEPCAAKRAAGAVVAPDRVGGGQVGFHVGEDLNNSHVLGGNKGNRVSIMRFARTDVLPNAGCSAPRHPTPVTIRAIGDSSLQVGRIAMRLPS
jgi:hypothetical protein